jgi:hypothetical protein
MPSCQFCGTLNLGFGGVFDGVDWIATRVAGMFR